LQPKYNPLSNRSPIGGELIIEDTQALAIEVDDRDGRLRRDALHAPDRELIEHDVADDHDRPIGDARDERSKGGKGRRVRRHRASASSAVRSDA
jgi:hypothetical protein